MDSEEAILKEIVRTIRAFGTPERIILFGSRAKGHGGRYSDFDIAIEGMDIDIRTERRLKESLEDKIKVHIVEIINLDRADSAFREIVKKTGKVLYERGT